MDKPLNPKTTLIPKKPEHLKTAIGEEETVKTITCANKYCTTNPELTEFRQYKFKDEVDYYCNHCRESIAKNWICPFCYMIFNEHTRYPDLCVWICCDNTSCGSWTHQLCEQKYGITNIEAKLDDKNYKYLCLNCRKKTRRNGREDGRNRRAEKTLTPEEVCKHMIQKKKVSKPKYTYLYSEDYQSIEKLLTALGTGTSLKLSGEELESDLAGFRAIKNKIQGNDQDKAFETANLTKRTYKKFQQRTLVE